MIISRFRQYKVALLATLSVFVQSLPAQSPKPLDFQGLWIVRESMVSRAEVDRALPFARDAGFNHVFVQIRGRGDAYYKSLIVPRSDRIREADFDPLGYAVQRGHQLGLNVHAWVTTYLLWSARQPARSKAHLYNMHPEWLEVRADGFKQRDIDLSAPRDGSFEGVYLSPTHPEVNPYLRAIFTEILLNYAIDGLHLDYVRYFDLDYGYNEVGIRRFMESNGFDPRAISGPQLAPGGLTGGSDQMEIWHNYRRKKVSDLITSMHAIITLSGKEVMLTAAVKPNLRVARAKYFQDWLQWLKDGVLDYAMPMNYTPVREDYLTNLRITLEGVPYRMRRQVVMGIATYNQSATDAADRISLARMAGLRGIALFSYDTHKTDLSHFDAIVEALRR